MTVIDVYADIWCPFTHLGLRRFVERRDQEGADLRLRVYPWPLELVNGKPLDPDFIGEEIDDLRAQVSPGLFTGFRAETFPTTTLPALALVESAYAVDLAIGEVVSLLLRTELFEHGHDISDAEVLAEVAAEAGLPPAGEENRSAVEAGWEAGKERGVVGSPHFFTPSGDFFCPVLDIKRVDGHLAIKPDVPAFEAFVAACLS
jgi:predicted DsbA family dithiol-disulfide isomerase